MSALSHRNRAPVGESRTLLEGRGKSPQKLKGVKLSPNLFREVAYIYVSIVRQGRARIYNDSSSEGRVRV